MIILSKNNPYNVRQLYPKIDDFKRFLYQLPYAELKATLFRFENAEFFEDCVIIEEVIQEKIKYISTL